MEGWKFHPSPNLPPSVFLHFTQPSVSPTRVSSPSLRSSREAIRLLLTKVKPSVAENWKFMRKELIARSQDQRPPIHRCERADFVAVGTLQIVLHTSITSDILRKHASLLYTCIDKCLGGVTNARAGAPTY